MPRVGYRARHIALRLALRQQVQKGTLAASARAEHGGQPTGQEEARDGIEQQGALRALAARQPVGDVLRQTTPVRSA